MRAWVAIGALLIANTAAAQQRSGPTVPPLVEGEIAPVEAPNYFDARELGAATLAVYAACQAATAVAYPKLAEATQAAYCGCVADAARWNARLGRAADPTEAEVARCLDATRTQGRSPFARQLVTSTASIATVFHACMEAPSGAIAADTREFACSCTTNAWIADRLRASKLEDDKARCGAAGRYREDTGQNPTLRQFAAIRGATPGGADGRDGHVQPRTFLPYPGNGRGPTLCSDGSYSRSSGSGTCSHHGGIYGRHRRR
jgi:hypothetical protein